MATAHCRLPARVVSVLAIAGAVVASPRAAEMMNTHDRVPAHPQTHLVRTADAVPLSAAGGKWGTVKRPFRAAFNQRIPVNPVIAPRSQAIVAHLGRNRAAYANLHDYGTPIYYADRSTPRALVNCTRRWGPCDLEQGRVPIPAKAKPNAGSDAAMVIVDRNRGRVFEFWRTKRLSAGRWRAAWGEVVSVMGKGGFGSTGSGISRLAGVIRAEEVKAGVIPHALVFSTNNACRRVFKAPATKTDGKSERRDCIPEGARVQLSPAVTLGRLSLSRAERAVAVALQRYGAYVIDAGAVPIAFSFERPTRGLAPYVQAGLPWDYYRMKDIPWHRLRVLRRWDGA